jgi:hypothetical protein
LDGVEPITGAPLIFGAVETSGVFVSDVPDFAPVLFAVPLFAPPLFAPPLFAPPLFAPPLFAPPLFAPPLFAPPLFAPPLFVAVFPVFEPPVDPAFEPPAGSDSVECIELGVRGGVSLPLPAVSSFFARSAEKPPPGFFTGA